MAARRIVHQSMETLPTTVTRYLAPDSASLLNTKTGAVCEADYTTPGMPGSELFPLPLRTTGH